MTTARGVRNTRSLLPLPRRNGLRSIQSPQPNGWGLLIPLRHSSSSEKGHAAPPLLACKRARDVSACYQPFSGYGSSILPAEMPEISFSYGLDKRWDRTRGVPGNAGDRRRGGRRATGSAPRSKKPRIGAQRLEIRFRRKKITLNPNAWVQRLTANEQK